MREEKTQEYQPVIHDTPIHDPSFSRKKGKQQGDKASNFRTVLKNRMPKRKKAVNKKGVVCAKASMLVYLRDDKKEKLGF